jgi:hypothetical protein
MIRQTVSEVILNKAISSSPMTAYQVHAYHWWLSFHLMDLERYRKFEVSLERVMFFCPFFDIFCSNGQKF